jgi:predicted nucleic acid-binding protein
MAYFTCDTSTIVSRKLSDLPDNFLFSSVMLMELMAYATDETQRKVFERLFHDYEKDNSLIVPDADDWLVASRVLYWLEQGRRRSAKGRAPRLRPGARQRMALDVLIAVSAKSYDATVVTENWDDFKAIQHYYKFKLAKALISSGECASTEQHRSRPFSLSRCLARPSPADFFFGVQNNER